MPRSLWSGTISFGLVSVPVSMYTATESKELRFHFLDRRDLSPIGYDKINKTTGEHVDADQIIRGFEFEKGRFVEVGDEDIDRLDVELTHAIDICEFVSIDEIDPLFFRKGYYLLPQERRGEAVPSAARRPSSRRVASRSRRSSCATSSTSRASDPASACCLLETMYYADELRLPEDMPAPRLRDAETKMAISLIENLTAKWTPGKYHDQYRNELLELLTKKAEGKPLPEPSAEPRPASWICWTHFDSRFRQQEQVGDRSQAEQPQRRRPHPGSEPARARATDASFTSRGPAERVHLADVVRRTYNSVHTREEGRSVRCSFCS